MWSLRAEISAKEVTMSNSQLILEEYQTKKELADEFDKTPRTLDRWDALGVGPPRTCIGRTVLYRRASVQKWLAAQEVLPPYAVSSRQAIQQ